MVAFGDGFQVQHGFYRMAKKQETKEKKLENAIRKFLETYRAAAATTDEERSNVFKSGSFHAYGGVVVELNKDVNKSLSELINASSKMLDTKAGDERTISDIAFECGSALLTQKIDIREATKSLFQRIRAESYATFNFLTPNYLIRFEDNINNISLGPVRAVRTSIAVAELPQDVLQFDPQIPIGGGFIQSTPEEKQSSHLPKISWLISIRSTKANVREEAQWLVDVAASFLRLHYRVPTPYFPRYGDIEAHPFMVLPREKVGVIFTNTEMSGGSIGVPPHYVVGSEILKVTLEADFREKVELIYNPPKSSLAERVSRGLGWLSRGRRSTDRAERLLYFFTAVEALLTSDDKDAPVVQTICRHAAVIMSDEMEARLKIASDLRRLYALRSKLIHGGDRIISWKDATLTQFLSEALYFNVLDKMKLKLSYKEEFEASLQTGSYGLPWHYRTAENNEP